MSRFKAAGPVAGTALALAGAVAIVLSLGGAKVGAAASQSIAAAAGEVRPGSVTVPLSPVVTDVPIYGARAAGRPIVVIDPGHGGRDPGARGVSGEVVEKDLTLALAKVLRDELVARGRVRVAMAREDDRFLTLDQRGGIARRLAAALFLSLHMDSAPNPLARGATAYSLSEIASDQEAARLAARDNAADAAGGADAGGSVKALLSDLALRDQMNSSAGLAERLVRKSAGRVLLRPEPHRFADFRVLRGAAVPGVLFEAGYISNAQDEQLLVSSGYRDRLVAALARAVEADVAARGRR